MGQTDLDSATALWTAITALPSALLILGLVVLLIPPANRRFGRLLSPLRSVRFFGTEFILDPEGARHGREEFQRYRKQVKDEFELLVHRYRVQQQLEIVAIRVLEPTFEECFAAKIGRYRATVHVEDVLFRDSLYQLVDDYPRGGGRGQLKSTRFGLIGQAWRHLESRMHGPLGRQFDERVDVWGMNQSEAKTVGDGKQFFSATILHDEDNIPIGIFYVDSETNVASLDDERKREFHRRIGQGCSEYGLTQSTAKITHDLRGRSPLISIYD